MDDEAPQPKLVLHIDLVTIPKTELERLRAIEVRAIVKRDQPMPGTGSWRHPSTVATEILAARYILGEGEG